MSQREKEILAEALAKLNGKGGQPAYIVYKGRVVDVTHSKLWAEGIHMNRHHAGADLTAAIEGAPHGPEVLERFPEVGGLKSEELPERPMPRALKTLLGRFPALRRHPHPMVVHFPIVFMYATPLFTILYLITGIEAFETTALHCLGGGILFTIPAILTGLFTWWLNYFARPMRPVTMKIRLSLLMMAVSVVAFVWRVSVPDLMISLDATSIIYFILLLLLIPLVTLVGWFGAVMTFPLERN